MEANFKNSSILIGIIFSGIVLLILGGFAGVMYQSQKTGTVNSLTGGSNQVKALVDSLKSKAVSSIAIYGKVQSISGKTVKVSSNADTVSVLIADNAEFSLIDYSTKDAVRKTATFSNIKVGDNINISVKILDNYTLSGVSVAIFPATNINSK